LRSIIRKRARFANTTGGILARRAPLMRQPAGKSRQLRAASMPLTFPLHE